MRSSSIRVTFVYCSYKAQADQSIRDLLAAVLKQIAQAQSSPLEPIQDLYEKHVREGTRPSVEDISKTLQDVLTNKFTVYLVIDAIDECRDSDGTRGLFLAKLRDLQSKTDLRLMVTSRWIPDISSEFQSALTLEVQATEEDVKRFVNGQIHRLPRCIQRDVALQTMMQDKITGAVGGM